MNSEVGPTQLVGELYGAVDDFTAPRLLSGWAVNSESVGEGRDITISVYRGELLIGRDHLVGCRPDIVSSQDYLTEFRVVCTEDISDESIAFDVIRIVASDTSGRTKRLFIWDRVRGSALGRILGSAPPFGREATAVLLQSIVHNSNLPPKARDAVLDTHDRHFEEESRQLVYRFESLGKDGSLGALQRAYGAEPLGLLRFAGIGIDAVTRAIRDKFDGVGAAEFTRITAGDTQEYYSSDTRYGMSSHTFVHVGETDFQRFFDRQCKKLSFSATKIVEELEEGDRIFVIHAIPDRIPDSQLRNLLAAMRQLGNAPLLYLRPPSMDLPPGRLLTRSDGIMEGSVMAIQGADAAAEIRGSWLKVLRLACAEVFRRTHRNNLKRELVDGA
jgi:hypothetical protein